MEAVALEALEPNERAQIEALRGSEGQLDRWFLAKGMQYIHEHPWLTIGNGARKLGAAFGLLLSPQRAFFPNLVHALSYGTVMILGLWGMWASRRHWRDHLIFYALFATFILVTVIFFGHSNYRAYLDLYWIIFATGLLARDSSSSGVPLSGADDRR